MSGFITVTPTEWPGEKYTVPYSLHELYAHVAAYVAEHPKATLDRVHGHLVKKLGVCVYSHVRAVWILWKANQETK